MHSFNTSHVTLYRVSAETSEYCIKFQYISCYSLSVKHFNCFNELSKFQYISCYSLSIEEIGKQLGMKPFQYISCYSLSWMSKSELLSMLRFNTSHVTLYRRELWLFQSSLPVSIHLMLLFIPRFIGFSSSNSFYNTAKYKGLQDFYQPTSHFLFIQSKPGIPPYFQYFSFFYENLPGNFYNFSFNLLREFPCHVFTLTGEFFYYKIKSSPLSFFPFPSTSSPNTLSFINFIIHTKSSSLSITRFSSFLNCMNFDGVMSPLKTDFWI